MIKPKDATRPRGGNPASQLLKATEDLVFHHVHGGQLIYNTSWEDPRIDRQLLKLDGDSRVVMITSAGCNALDYLLDGPAEIHAVDINFRQNALLELKLAMIRRGEFGDFFEMFGIGSHTEYKRVYRSVQRDLPEFARKFWDGRMNFFDPGGLKKSFYYHGTAGAAAWIMGGALFKSKPNIKNFALCLLDADSIEQQREVYALLEPKIWDGISNWLIRQRLVMTLLGVPGPQVKLIEDHYPGGLGSYIKDKLRHVMSELPAAENYFWRVYLTGSYTMSCCPNYLRSKNQSTLASLSPRIRTHTCGISEFLRQNPGAYTHYVLLDHQDWLAWHDPEALREEWELILANSRPGTKILMRSAGLELDFVPADILARLRFFPEITGPLHQLDRVGTYGSLSFAEVL
jgi:S-adenosylmethionine-diacylglycerol 3-amino-3-carboxypropyl transferase